MESKQSPPPYSSNADVPMTSPPGMGYCYAPQPIPVPTFEPPYMSQYPPSQYPPAGPPQQPPATQTQVTIGSAPYRAGACPVCQGTAWTGSYSCCAWFLAIIFFPIGILCCLCMRKKKCSKCGFALG